MGTYYQSSTASGLTLSGFTRMQVNNILDPATAGVTTVTASIAASAGSFPSTNPDIVFVIAGPATLNWGSGYTAQVDVVSDTSLTVTPTTHRRKSSDNTALRSGGSGSSFTGTGLKTWTATSDLDGAAGASTTDNFMFVLGAANGDMMAAQNLTLNVNTVDAYVTVPWTVSTGPATSMVFPPRTRRADMRHRLNR